MIWQSHIWACSQRSCNHNLKEIPPPLCSLQLIHNSQDTGAAKCPWTDECLKEPWYICTTESYAAIKKEEILPFATP